MWDFDNGETGTGNINTTSYDAGGIYQVLLNFEEVGTGCQNSSTMTVQVHDYPEADFTSNLDGMSIICYPQNALFMDYRTSANSFKLPMGFW